MTPMEARVAEIITPTLQDMGFDLVRVQVQAVNNRKILQIMAEKAGSTGVQGGISVEDCAQISRALSAVLDVEDPISDAFVLEVSSPGLDRPLTRPADFTRFAGHEVRLETDVTFDDRRRFKGVLVGLATEQGEDLVRIATDDGQDLALPLASLVKAKLVVTDELIAEALKGEVWTGNSDDDDTDEEKSA